MGYSFDSGHDITNIQNLSTPPSDASSGSGGNNFTNISGYVTHDANDFHDELNLLQPSTEAESGSGGNNFTNISGYVTHDANDFHDELALSIPDSTASSGSGGNTVTNTSGYIGHDGNDIISYQNLEQPSIQFDEMDIYGFELYVENFLYFKANLDKLELEEKSKESNTTNECGKTEVEVDGNDKIIIAEGVVPRSKLPQLKTIARASQVWKVVTHLDTYRCIVKSSNITVDGGGDFVGQFYDKKEIKFTKGEDKIEFSLKLEQI